MKVEKAEQLKLKLKGDDAKNFTSGFKKLVSNLSKAGFGLPSLTDGELKILKSVEEKL